MTDRAGRRTEQQAKINAMSLGKRLAMVVATIASAMLAVGLVSLVMDGEVNLGFALLISLAAGLGISYQYLWVPSRGRS